MIHETIITTRDPDGGTHIAPMGIREQDGYLVIAPFKPSRTLENLEREGEAVVNASDNVQIFAGCLVGRSDWDVSACESIRTKRLRDCLAHREVRVVKRVDDPIRPEFHCEVLLSRAHREFRGYNRAQAAVIEACILVSRLNMLPAEKIAREVEYLNIAIDKTAGQAERDAWDWLMTYLSTNSDIRLSK